MQKKKFVIIFFLVIMFGNIFAFNVLAKSSSSIVSPVTDPKLWFHYERSDEPGSSGDLVVTDGKIKHTVGVFSGPDLREVVKSNTTALYYAKKQMILNKVAWGSLIPMVAAEIFALEAIRGGRSRAAVAWTGVTLGFAVTCIYTAFLSEKYFYRAIDSFNGVPNYHPKHLSVRETGGSLVSGVGYTENSVQQEGFRFAYHRNRQQRNRHQQELVRDLTQEWKQIQLTFLF